MTAIGVPAVLALALVMFGVAQDAAVAAPRVGHSCAWAIVSSPSPGTDRNMLFGASGAPGGQVWAVGDRVSLGSARFVAPVVDRWTGSAWAVRVLPGNQSNVLGVFAPAKADVWAVGFFIVELDNTLPVIDHFNGRTWRIVASPRIRFGVLSGVGGTSGRDIWAIGRKLARPTVTVIEHYDGHAWTRVASPSPVTDYMDFGAIKALSPRDVWAAGDYLNAKGVSRTVIEHYNGRSWTIVPSPDIGSGDNFLSGIAALGPQNVWAVGRARVGARFVPLALRWNGHAWSARTLPAAGPGDNTLNGITNAAGNLWAVGSAARARGVQRTLTERYADGRWRIVPSPDANSADNTLYAATVTGGDQVWAVGNWTSPTRGKTLTMRRCAG
jgi:hypothetical protein